MRITIVATGFTKDGAARPAVASKTASFGARAEAPKAKPADDFLDGLL